MPRYIFSSGFSIDYLKEIFNREHVPSALVWIALVESDLNPNAVSPRGAVGLFQFMPETAIRFGLRIDTVDERLNPEKSAIAAAQYLRELYDQFGSWDLALAAYNAGEGRISQALIDQHAFTFDEIAYELPSETRLYVPKVFQAIEDHEGMAAKLRLS